MNTFYQFPPRVQKVVETTEEFLKKNGIEEVYDFPQRLDIPMIPRAFQ